jgi:hypothetical protein
MTSPSEQVIISTFSFKAYSSQLCHILRSLSSLIGSYTDLRTFLAKIVRAFSSDVGTAHVSDVYVRNGLINDVLLHDFTFQ